MTAMPFWRSIVYQLLGHFAVTVLELFIFAAADEGFSSSNSKTVGRESTEEACKDIGWLCRYFVDGQETVDGDIDIGDPSEASVLSITSASSDPKLVNMCWRLKLRSKNSGPFVMQGFNEHLNLTGY